MSNTQLAKQDHQYALMLQKYAHNISEARPNLGPVAKEFATTLLRSELSPRMARNIMDIVYQPERKGTKGSGSKMKYFGEAVLDHFGEHTLTRVANDVGVFRRFVRDIEDVESFRADLKEYGIGLSYQQSLYLAHTCQLSAENVVELTSQIQDQHKERTGRNLSKKAVMARLNQAIDLSRTQRNCLETIIEFMQ